MDSESLMINILLAEDDQDDRDLFLEILEESGVTSRLTTVHDGKMLTDYLAGISDPPPPDVIFLDINMPFKDGKTCLKEIRQNKKFKNVPIIMFTTSTHRKDIEDSYHNGANRYILKSDFYKQEKNILKSIFRDKEWYKALMNVDRKEFVYRLN
jgi:CheY-like chemotaxis protein